MLSRIVLAASVILAAPAAWAQSPTCSTCADCTAALASANGQAQLAADIAFHGSDPCVVVRGAGARFDGQGHVILAQPAGGTGVRVEAEGAGVRNVRITGSDVGVHIANARDVTLYNVTTESRATGVLVESSPGARLDHVHTVGGRVGISFGAAADGTCPAGLSVRSAGAVVLRSAVERAGTGIAACDALPVLTGNTVTRNQVGVILGHPAGAAGNGGAAPYDGCVCAPELEGMHPASLAMFSSGCASCQVHEGWMASLRRQGADVRVRESGPHTEDAQARFDRYGWRCMPGVMDSLGIPGCVPNYACVSSGAFSKRRQNGTELINDVPINSEEEALRFARQCAGSAQGRYARGARCVTQAVVDNTFCNNRTMDVRLVGEAARWGGARNRCGHVEGWTEASRQGCSQGCDAAPEAPPLADLAPPTGSPFAPGTQVALEPPTAPVPSTPTAPTPTAPTPTAPTTATAARSGAPSGDEPLYLVGAMVAAVLAGGWFFRKRA